LRIPSEYNKLKDAEQWFQEHQAHIARELSRIRVKENIKHTGFVNEVVKN